MVDERQALPGRKMASVISGVHFVSGHPIKGNMPDGISRAIFGLGCFWGAEKSFWQIPGVYATAVVYVAGFTENPTYEEVCSGMTGHNEAVLVFYLEASITYGHLLRVFWEAHDPTQGLRQGNDVGSQYRSGIYTDNSFQFELATLSRDRYQKKLMDQNFGEISTEIISIDQFYYAEEYHQQYLAKNPQGYCGPGGTGVCFGSDCTIERSLE